MPNNKRYYWLKLKEDFFRNREVKKLRNIAGGDTYTIIYLKMQLVSIQEGGVIVFEGTEEDLSEQLALELDEDLENIKITLSYLNANKLLEQLSENEYLLNKVPELIGSETTAAERMRKMREKRNSVTEVLQPVTNCYTEIEIERRDKREEIETDDVVEDVVLRKEDIELIIKKWNELNLQQLVVINKNTKRHGMLKSRIKEFSLDKVMEAIDGISKSKFLQGQNDRGWTITFDWLVRPNNFLKVLEGNYTDKGEKHGTNRGKSGNGVKEDEYVAGFAELDLDEVFKVQNEQGSDN